MLSDAQRARIVALAKDGAQRVDIAREIGCSRQTVYTVICAARQRGEAIPHGAAGRDAQWDRRPRVFVDRALLDRLQPHADARAVPVRDLARLILTTVARDNLVNAILDDTPHNRS